MSGEIMAAALAGVAIAFSVICIAIASGGLSTGAVIRMMRGLAPRDRRSGSREHCSPAFDCYYHRQRELEQLFSARLDLQRRLYADYEIVLAVHRWELPMILDMPQVQQGKLYGEYPVVAWQVEDCDIVSSKDPRIRFRGSHTSGGNGALPIF